MAKINRSELTKEQLSKALECKTSDELIALAKAEGYDITKDEAEAYLAQMANMELDTRIWRKWPAGSMIYAGGSLVVITYNFLKIS